MSEKVTFLVPPSSNRPSEGNRFAISFLVAAVIEIAFVLALVVVSKQLVFGPPAPKHEVVQLQIVPPPPKPVVQPKPPPPQPKPLPKPVPKPVPKPIPKPVPKPLPKPLPRKVVRRPKPQPKPLPRPVTQPVTQPVAQIAPAPSPAEVESVIAAYVEALRTRVQGNLEVPENIRLLGFSGKAEVLIRLAPDGQLLGVSLADSSGVPPIDTLALKTVRETTFPAFFPKMPHRSLSFTLMVNVRR